MRKAGRRSTASLFLSPSHALGNEMMRLPVRFVIDTGADRTLIMPVDYRPYVYRDFRSFPLEFPGGFGGAFEARSVLPVLLHFEHQNGKYVQVTVEAELARPSDEIEKFGVSVLGRDVIDYYRLVVDKPNNEVSIDVKLPDLSNP